MEQSGILAKAEKEDKDWINKLPNCILSSIVSLLTIKDAMDAGMISRQWRNLCLDAVLTRPNLEIDIPNIFGSRYVDPNKPYPLVDQCIRQDFISRVNKFLKSYHGKKVDSFKVTFGLAGVFDNILDEWIHFAITKGVEVLHIRLKFFIRSTMYDYDFPCWLLSNSSSSTLKHLSLKRCALSYHCDIFKQLRSICLKQVYAVGIDMANLCSVCLFLESLTLVRCNIGSHLIVSSPLLRLNDLTVINCHKPLKVDISAVNLVSLEYVGDVSNISFINNPRSERLYCLIVLKATFSRALTQFAALQGLESLSLKLMVGVELPESVPTFRKLKKLYLYTHYYRAKDIADIDLTGVLNFLKGTPYLEELVITAPSPKFKEDNQREIRDISGFSHDHLKNVKIGLFRSHSHEIEFAMCILKHTKNLEMMVMDRVGKRYQGCGKWVKLAWVENCVPHWEEKRRPFVEAKLKEVKTNARVIIL